MRIYGIELRTADWPRLVAWYRDIVGLRSTVRQTEEQYALLAGTALQGATLSIFGRSEPDDVSYRMNLVIEVDDLDALAERLAGKVTGDAQPTSSAEGYREIVTHDPDGNRVRFIDWT